MRPHPTSSTSVAAISSARRLERRRCACLPSVIAAPLSRSCSARRPLQASISGRNDIETATSNPAPATISNTVASIAIGAPVIVGRPSWRSIIGREGAEGQLRQEQPDREGSGTEQGGFGAEHPAQLPTARPERQAQRDLLLTSSRAEHDQHGDVGAHDRQHQPCCGRDADQHRPELAGVALARRFERHAGPVGGKIAGDGARCRGDALLGHAGRHTRLEAHHVGADGRRQRNDDFDRHAAVVADVEVRRKDADDAEALAAPGFILCLQLAADRGRI